MKKLIVLIMAVAVFAAAFVHFDNAYPVQISGLGGPTVVVSNLLFNAFVAGAVFGALIIAFVSEGEYVMGLRKIVYAMDGKNGKSRNGSPRDSGASGRVRRKAR